MQADDTCHVGFEGVMKSYDGIHTVVDDLDLSVERGEFLTLLGPSGSGKTTTLMMLAGFEQPTAGTILLNGSPITGLPAHRRGIGMVFQNYALFPHMSVAANLAFPLEVRHVPKDVIAAKVARALDMVKLPGVADRRPQQLSGGQQQRIALARALVFEPQLILMDEPLGALDKQLREHMQYEIRSIHERLGVTIVYVTHDQGEALTMSNRIAVFGNGRIQQLATPEILYERPRNAFVAAFIGENNRIPGTMCDLSDLGCRVRLANGAIVPAARGDVGATSRDVMVSVRPERVRLSPPEAGATGNSVGIIGRLTDLIYHGDHVRCVVVADDIGELVAKVPSDGRRVLPQAGALVRVEWDQADGQALCIDPSVSPINGPVP